MLTVYSNSSPRLFPNLTAPPTPRASPIFRAIGIRIEALYWTQSNQAVSHK